MCPLPARINYANYVYQLVTSTHVLMNGVFSVLFKKCWQFVLCVISESFLIVCLFVLIYTVSQKVLKVHFWRPFSKVIFSTGNTMELVMCLSLLKRPKTVSVNIKYSFPGYLTAPKSFYFPQQFSELHKHYTAYSITCREKPITCSCRSCCCEFPLGRKFE